MQTRWVKVSRDLLNLLVIQLLSPSSGYLTINNSLVLQTECWVVNSEDRTMRVSWLL